MEGNLFNRLVYVDHNVLDRMTKGEYLGLIDFFKKNSLIVAYSSESLNEIKRSVGFESSFLDVLKAMEARYIVPNIDNNSIPMGTAQVQDGDPHSIYQSYIDNYTTIPKHGYGLTSMLIKMYGGMTEMSFSQIFENGAKEIIESIQIPESDIDSLELSLEEKKNIKDHLQTLQTFLKKEYSELGNILDSNPLDNSVKEFEKVTGIGSKILKNISGQNLLIQVWEHIQKAMPVDNISLEQFFGIETVKGLSVVQKVNAIYHQLNYVGFYRDSNMKTERRFIASLSDMTHAGIATYCKLFFCRDQDLVMKASAAYEYLNLPTHIIHIKD